jgi:hypothetical protein
MPRSRYIPPDRYKACDLLKSRSPVAVNGVLLRVNAIHGTSIHTRRVLYSNAWFLQLHKP